MKKYKAEVVIMPHKELLDPQGKTVLKNLPNVGVAGVDDVRIGKHIHMELEAENESGAKEAVETACKKILANQIMETFEFTIEEV